MFRSLLNVTAIALVYGLLTNATFGQLDGLYEFDAGGDGSSWDDALNWEQKLDPFGAPISGDPATPPSATTSTDIPLLGVVVVDGTQAGQTALDVNIGTANGGGSLTITGGDLTGRDVFVGRDSGGINLGLLAMSGGTLNAGDDITLGAGSVGVMTMSAGSASTGDDFFINANSSLTMNDGSIAIGDRLVMNDNAGLILNNGSIVADDDFYFFGNSQITVNNGSMIVQDKLRFDGDEANNGKLTINGGIVRSNEFGLESDGLLTDFRGVVEINGDGILQVELGVDDNTPGSGTPITQISQATANALIAEGVHLTTSESNPLIAQLVTVPDFFGRQDVTFVQISVVPEPASAMLLCIGGLGLALRRRT